MSVHLDMLMDAIKCALILLDLTSAYATTAPTESLMMERRAQVQS